MYREGFISRACLGGKKREEGEKEERRRKGKEETTTTTTAAAATKRTKARAVSMEVGARAVKGKCARRAATRGKGEKKAGIFLLSTDRPRPFRLERTSSALVRTPSPTYTDAARAVCRTRERNRSHLREARVARKEAGSAGRG